MTREEYESSLYLAHHGIKGQKWGIRKYQNEDGSLTEAGMARYGVKSNGKMSFKGKRQFKKDQANSKVLDEQEKKINQFQKDLDDEIAEKKRVNSKKFGTTDDDKDFIEGLGDKEYARLMLNEMLDEGIDTYTDEVRYGKQEYERLLKLYKLD